MQYNTCDSTTSATDMVTDPRQQEDSQGLSADWRRKVQTNGLATTKSSSTKAEHKPQTGFPPIPQTA